jgi:hypothetical protein
MKRKLKINNEAVKGEKRVFIPQSSSSQEI